MIEHTMSDVSVQRGLTLQNYPLALWSNSADDQTDIFLIFLRKQCVIFHENCLSSGDNLHDMSNPIFWKNNENISKCQQEICQMAISRLLVVF